MEKDMEKYVLSSEDLDKAAGGSKFGDPEFVRIDSLKYTESIKQGVCPDCRLLTLDFKGTGCYECRNEGCKACFVVYAGEKPTVNSAFF
jgi:hypothetical protein